MRVALLLFLLAALGRADGATVVDEILEALARGDAKRARALAQKALSKGPHSEIETLRGVADRLLETRRIQRARGYDAALDYLEKNIDHWVLAQAYGEAARWAGQEERGLKGLRQSSLPLAQRIEPELYLLSMIQRYDEVVVCARQAQETISWDALDGWVAFGAREARLRRGLAARADRAVWLALGALVAILAGCGVAWRLAPRPPVNKDA